MESCTASSLAEYLLDRLDFELPEFNRCIWVSENAKENWEPRINRIISACLELEWLSVAANLRSCSVLLVRLSELVARTKQWSAHGLNVLPLETERLGNNADTKEDTDTEKRIALRIVLGKKNNAVRFMEAWDGADHRQLAILLGYPKCCYEFYQELCLERIIDPTWLMSIVQGDKPTGSRFIEVTGNREANILWRWMGIRILPHLPCRFDCNASVELGRNIIQMGYKSGYQAEMDWLLEILSWPLEWSALHGIAEIKTPILKISTRTDATAKKYVVRRRGDSYPNDGARGLAFPYYGGALREGDCC